MNPPILIKYLRLSIEDDTNMESNSIGNQRDLLNAYILQNEELSSYESKELRDDGYSGTHFNRPGVKKLFTLIYKRNVKCIIVKDFSRFSRDYIELGYYLEQVFPQMGIRFISINDSYDSQTMRNDQQGLEIALKGILYDLYSKDLSRKLKAAKELSRKQGKLSGGSYPFGYRKTASDHGCFYEIDEEAAQIVRKIFRLALAHQSKIQIARKLNEEHILTPGMYKRSQGAFGYGLAQHTDAVWDAAKIAVILNEERYTGTMVLGRYRGAGIGTGKTICMPKEQWIRIPNSHPVIISDKDFRCIQEQKGSSTMKRERKGCHMFFKKIKCAVCGRFLYHKPSNSGEEYNSFYCKQPHLCMEKKCLKGYLKELVLKEILLCIIQIQKPNILELDKEKVNALLEMVSVYDVDRICIRWKYDYNFIP